MNWKRYKQEILLGTCAFFLSAILGSLIASLLNQGLSNQYRSSTVNVSTSPTPEPTPVSKDVYTIYLVGDSMTHALGPYGGQFNQYIHESYPEKHFPIQNYGKANQNILSLEERLTESLQTWDTEFSPILEGDPDFLIIESFGYNPLSHLGTEEGLKQHSQTLDKLLPRIKEELPNTKIIFLATLAPDKDTYAHRILGSNKESSRLAAEERIMYIEHHISYAQDHNIPIINVYARSIVNGDGDPRYINPDDQIHPSVEGIELISRTMQDFFTSNDYIR